MRDSPPPLDDQDAEIEVAVLDVLVHLSGRLKLLALFCLFGFALGLGSALIAEPEYRSSFRAVSELGSDAAGGGLANTLLNFGFRMPSTGASSLSGRAIPDLVETREVLLSILADTVYTVNGPTSVLGWVTRPPSRWNRFTTTVSAYTIGLPGRILASMSGEDTAASESPPLTHEIRILTEDERAALSWLGSVLTVDEDLQVSGFITFQAVTPDPLLSASLLERVRIRLQSRVREVYSAKAREDAEFVQARFVEAEEQLREAGERLAQFRDRNQNVSSSRVSLVEEQLQREVSFAAQLFADLQAQDIQAQFDLQKSRAVLTLIEAPVPAALPSGPSKALTVILGTLLGAIAGLFYLILERVARLSLRRPEVTSAIAEIRAEFKGLLLGVPLLRTWIHRSTDRRKSGP